MRKLLALFLAMMLPVCAGAETLRKQVNAPEHASGQWTSNTGHTIITMDAVVMVPDTDHVNTYALSGRDASYQDAMHMALGVASDMSWAYDWACSQYPDTASWDGRRESPYIIRHSDTGDIVMNYLFEKQPCEEIGSYNWHLETVFGEKRILATTSYRYDQEFSYSHNVFFSAEIGIQDHEALPGQTGSLAQARMLAENLAASFGEDFHLARTARVEANETLQARMESNDADGDAYGPWAYWFCFTRCVDGMPVTLTDTAAFEDSENVRDQPYESSPKEEKLICVVDQGRIVLAELMNPWTVGGSFRKMLCCCPLMRSSGYLAPSRLCRFSMRKAMWRRTI